MWNTYYVPATLDEAAQLLETLAGDASEDGASEDGASKDRARIIAGGTDLILELERGARRAGALIDISRLAGLDSIRLDEAGWIHLGPLVTHSQVAASRLCVERAFPLAQACRQVGAPQIRNRATVAGNLITASPANDTITPLTALGATVALRSARGQRWAPLSDFYTGVRRTVMQPDEILVDIAFPALDPARQRGVFIKLGLRRAQAISLVNVAVVIDLADGGQPSPPQVAGARIALGAVAPTIVRARDAEAALAGRQLDEAAAGQAARLAQAAAVPIDDVRAGAAHRRRLVGAAVRRALIQLAGGGERDGWNDDPVALAIPAVGAAAAAQSQRFPSDICLTVDGREYRIQGAAGKTLLRLLREDCGLTGVKEGCAEGECGACTVLMDGKAVMACLVPAPRAHGARIITVAGISALAPRASQDSGLHPVQQAFIDEGAVQCGYCTPGFVVSGAALLSECAHPTPAQIKEGISGNLCRCTGYYKIVSAIQRAAVMNPQ